MIFPIWTIYTFSIKSCYSYLNIFSILPPIISLYRLTIATLYRHLYIKYIEITYNISYTGSHIITCRFTFQNLCLVVLSCDMSRFPQVCTAGWQSSNDDQLPPPLSKL